MPPLILGNLISYRGFKELAFIAAQFRHYLCDRRGSRQDVLDEASGIREPGSTEWTTLSFDLPGGLTAMPAMPACRPSCGLRRPHRLWLPRPALRERARPEDLSRHSAPPRSTQFRAMAGCISSIRRQVTIRCSQ